MDQKPPSKHTVKSVMVFGVGSFAHSVTQILREHGARVCAYLTRDYGHFGPSMVGAVYDSSEHATPFAAIEEVKPDFIVPMAIEWALKPWTKEFSRRGLPILCTQGEGLNLERDRDCARDLCSKYRIPFAQAHRVRDRVEAAELVRRRRRPFVIKNPLCSPFSPIHTIVCESPADTLSWLERIDDTEGIFLQEYLGRAEVGHIALVSGGEIYPLVTNQEYKRAFDGNMGIVAGAPLGGLVQKDPQDQYGLVRELIEPLKPWLRQVNFHGPLQVTAIKHRGRWKVLEYNVRLGVTSGALILRLLANPLEVLEHTVLNRKLNIRFRPGMRFGCSITLAGYGYPFVQLEGPRVPVQVQGKPTCDIWWSEVSRDAQKTLWATGHRIADVTAVGGSLKSVLATAYKNIQRIRSMGSYYRTDIGKSLWPPGSE